MQAARGSIPPMKDALQAGLMTIVPGAPPSLTLRQLLILLHLSDQPDPVTLVELGRALNLPRGTVTRGIERLQAESFVDRRLQDPANSRSVIIAVTRLGQRFLHSLEDAMLEGLGVQPPRRRAS